MTELLFDIAWWVPLLVVVMGVALLVMGNNRQNSGMRNGGAAVGLLGIVWLVLSFVMDTPTKICQKQTRQLVQDMADGNWAAFDQLTDNGVTWDFVERPWHGAGRAEVKAGAQDNIKKAGLHSASIGHVKAARDGEKITVGFTAYTDTELTPGHPIDSDWEFDWRPAGDQWHLAAMRVSRVDGTSPEGIRQSLNKK